MIPLTRKYAIVDIDDYVTKHCLDVANATAWSQTNYIDEQSDIICHQKNKIEQQVESISTRDATIDELQRDNHELQISATHAIEDALSADKLTIEFAGQRNFFKNKYLISAFSAFISIILNIYLLKYLP